MHQKILVTGASGFVGRHVVQELLDRGCNVVASSRSEASASICDWFGKVDYLPCDIYADHRQTNLLSYFGHPQRLIHLAWDGLPNYESESHLSSNLPSHKLFLNQLVTEGLNHLTVAGTCMEYGLQEGELSEHLAAMPANAYARAKYELWRYLTQVAPYSHFKLSWVRMFYMFGKGQNPNSLHSQLIRAIEERDQEFKMSPGDQLRDFLPVEEVAACIVRIACQDEITGIINCCSGKPISVEEFVNRVLSLEGSNIRLNKGYYNYSSLEPKHFWGSTRKLNKILKKDNGSC